MLTRDFIFFLLPAVVGLGGGVSGCSEGSSEGALSTQDGSVPPSREPILDGGGEILAPPNGRELCPAGACNYQTGEGCSSDAGPASCVPLPPGPAATGVTPTCVPAGRVPNGGTCREWTDCGPGSVCAAGRCRKLCCGMDWTGCPADEHCLRPFQVQLPNNSVVDSKAYLCFPVNQCDALVPSSCGPIEPNTTCQIADPTGATACLPEGTGGAREPCPCKGGFTCVGAVCRRLCKAVPGGGEPFCPDDEGTCVHFNRNPPGVGECTL